MFQRTANRTSKSTCNKQFRGRLLRIVTDPMLPISGNFFDAEIGWDIAPGRGRVPAAFRAEGSLALYLEAIPSQVIVHPAALMRPGVREHRPADETERRWPNTGAPRVDLIKDAPFRTGAGFLQLHPGLMRPDSVYAEGNGYYQRLGVSLYGADGRANHRAPDDRGAMTHLLQDFAESDAGPFLSSGTGQNTATNDPFVSESIAGCFVPVTVLISGFCTQMWQFHPNHRASGGFTTHLEIA